MFIFCIWAFHAHGIACYQFRHDRMYHHGMWLMLFYNSHY
jgi:hypothetical protein